MDCFNWPWTYRKLIDTLIFLLVPSHFVSLFLPCLELNVKLEMHRLARRCILSNPLLILSSIVLYLTTTYFILTDNCCLASVLWSLQIIINSDKMVTVGVVVKQPRRRWGNAQFHISVCRAFSTTVLSNLFVSPTTHSFCKGSRMKSSNISHIQISGCGLIWESRAPSSAPV